MRVDKINKISGNGICIDYLKDLYWLIELVYIDWLIDFSISVGVFFCGLGVFFMILYKMCNKYFIVGGIKFFYNKENFWFTLLVYKIFIMIIDILFLYLLMY